MGNPRQVNFCLGKLILKLLARIGEWRQNLSEKTVILAKETDHITISIT